MPQGLEYARGIRRGVVEALEQVSGWRVLQLPMRESGRPPVRDGMDSLDGLVTWAEPRDAWIGDLVAKGIPIVNCNGAWQGTAGVAAVMPRSHSVLELAVKHFQELSLERIVFLGHRITSDPSRAMMADMLADLAAPVGIEVLRIETRGKNPDEDLERLLRPRNEHRLLREFAALKGHFGMFAEHDYLARLACDVAARAGKRVPADLAILGAAGDLLGRFGSPTISTIPLPGREIGKRAFDLIEEFHRGVPLPSEPVEIEASTVVIRESTGGKAGDIAMERVFRCIEREAYRGLTVEELASVAGMSPKAVRRRYRKVHGEEPSTHIRRLRLDRARQLLECSGLPIMEVASLCGFSSQSAFCNYFLRHENISPTAFRMEREEVARS